MSDIKSINRQFFVALISFVVIIVVALVGTLLAYIYIKNYNITYPIYLTVLLLMIFISSRYKNTFDQIANLSYIIKIRGNEAKPLDIHKLVNLDHANIVFKKYDYLHFSQDNAYSIYYKVTKDHIKKIFRHYILTIIVVLHNKNADFYLDRVDKEINKLRDQQYKEKRKVDRLIITQIKEISDLSDATKETIKEIVFIRTNRIVISTINVGLYKTAQKAVMLYSDTYSPSLYYNYHIDEIKNVI